MSLETNPGAASYNELMLGINSRSVLLKNLMEGVGYGFSGAQTIPGLSGMSHHFDAIGTKGKNLLLVIGGADDRTRSRDHGDTTPRAEMESWRDRALLSGYDVQKALEQEGVIVDLLFFHNINHSAGIPESKAGPQEWLKEKKLPIDTGMRFIISIFDIPTLSKEQLATTAESVGGCFLSLDDMSIEEIAILTDPNGGDVVKKKVSDVLSRRRVQQYFHPPTDELILTGYGISQRKDRKLAEEMTHTAASIGHEPVRNAIVPEASFLDPLETARALEDRKFIHFESNVEITESGYKVTQIIRKSAQGNLVVRVLKTLGIGALAKGILETVRGKPG
jgi:hypothetical protein